MRKKYFFTLLIIIFVLFFAILANAENLKGKLAKNLADKSKDSISNAEIKKFLKSSDETSIRVFVKLKENSKIDRNILNEKIKNNFENGFSAVVDKADLQRLIADSSVESVTPIQTRQIFLQDSTFLINASTVWRLNVSSLNLTGRGQTICIIDTGINYTHPDLGGCYGNNSVATGCKVIGGWDYCADNVDCTTEDDDPYDVNWHGTHVAGIAAANGSITGVAPEAKIIMMKAGNSSGTFWDDDVLSAFDRCIDNSSAFNISVISMSLGAGAYTNYCDDELNGDGVPEGDNFDYVSVLRNATAKNISVVISSGNGHYYNAISAPACLKEAIPVTSTNEAGSSISDFANTWNDSSMLIVAAPGENINSTYLLSKGGSYAEADGTSMATPHAAGAIAIINQYLTEVGKKKNSTDIEILLNKTGTRIDDTAVSGRYFPRVNIYDAIVSLDSDGYYINLSSPANATSTNQNRTYNCSATSVSNLINITLRIWDSSKDLVFNYTSNFSGKSNESVVAYNFTAEGNYSWNCEASDEIGIVKTASSNYSIIYDILTKPIITVNNPLNGLWNNGLFNATINEAGSCFYSLNNTLNISMTSSDNLNFISVNNSLIQDSAYSLSFFCNDSAGNMNLTDIYFYFDFISPNVSITGSLPANETTDSTTKRFYYNTSDNLNITGCYLVINGTNVLSNESAVTNMTNNFTKTFTPGIFEWSINCTDQAGNTGNSSKNSFTITVPESSPSGGSSGGSGGGGGAISTTQNINLNERQLSQGATNSLGNGDKVSFSLENESHSIKINKISNNSANITISSEPFTIVLAGGEAIKLNLTSKEFYDLFIKVENITGTKANVTIQLINESIAVKTSNIAGKTLTENMNGIASDNINPIFYAIGGILVVLGIVLIHYFAGKEKSNISKTSRRKSARKKK